MTAITSQKVAVCEKRAVAACRCMTLAAVARDLGLVAHESTANQKGYATRQRRPIGSRPTEH